MCSQLKQEKQRRRRRKRRCKDIMKRRISGEYRVLFDRKVHKRGYQKKKKRKTNKQTKTRDIRLCTYILEKVIQE